MSMSLLSSEAGNYAKRAKSVILIYNQDQRTARWIAKQNKRDYEVFCREHAQEIADIKQHDPAWELPVPT